MDQDTKKSIEDIYELTPMQQGMLFHTLYTEESDAYFEQFCYNLVGNLDEELFQKSWEEIVKRHGVLRTSFQWKGISKPVQLVSRIVKLPWRNLDWRNLTTEQQQSEFKEFVKKDRAIGFDMEKPPLMRCTLIRLGDDSYQFVWSFHHIIMDGWSYPVLQKEVFIFYEALIKGVAADLPKPLSYKQFILWLNQQDKKVAEDFWRKELKDFDSPTPMITNGEIKTGKIEEVNDLEIKLSPVLTARIQSFAKQNQLTLNTIIQGVWAIILSVYRGEKDVLFGGTVSGRTPLLKGIETMVGLFINTLPVKVNVDKEKEIIQWFKNLQQSHIERNEFAYSSLVDIQEWSNIPRGTQLFENILVFENYPLDKSLENGVAGIKINNLRAFERTNFPLTILIAPGESLTIHIAYETSKFESSFIKQILSNFNTLLEDITKNPARKISDLSLLTEDEKKKILIDWNNTKHDFPKDKTASQLFEEQVEKTPGAIAVELDNKALTYRELNEKSNQVANYLKRFGVEHGVMVGICIDRSFEMITGLLGILKAGGAYVPLDSSYPLERLEFMIEDTNAPVLLSKENLADRLPKTKAKVVLMDKDSDEISKEDRNNVEQKAIASDLAYIIYTSGSTGKPKGVLMKHEALINLLYWQLEGQKFEKEFRVLQFTTLSFDVSFQEIFSTWYSGGTLVMMKNEDRQDLSKVLQIIKDKKIQRLFLPFIALQEIAEVFYVTKEKTLSLKEVNTAGEQLQNTPAIINLFNSLKNFTFTNQYGPAEAHVVTSYTLSDDTKNWMKLPPIGKPIFNTQMYVLDSSLKPVPVGVNGDLYIGGIGLVKGYHNREELTREKFIDNPFYRKDKNLSEKLYKTGDIARFLPDGNLEYLGRTDNQIKLRGIRIELGEIETVLAEYSEIRNVAVVVKEFNPGDKRLVAYYVSANDTILKAADLKKYLKTKLPEYMVPSDFVAMKEMPLTPTGKINHSALPSPESIRINESNNYVEPKETLELQLVKIWEKVLGVKPIGIKDNFFELGGHSLLALRVFGYTEKLTGRKLGLSTLFNSPTIEQLAAILKDEGWTPPWKSLVAVKPGGSKLPFFCVPPGAGTALHFQGMVKYIPNDQPFYVLESVGLDGKEKPHDNIEEMASHYIKEIQSLQPDGPYMLGGRCFGGRVVFEMAQQLTKLGQKVALLAIFDTWPPFIAPTQPWIQQKRDLSHFITRSFHHLKTGELSKVMYRYSSNKFLKLKWKVQNKLEWIFSDERKRLFKKIMLLHFHAQDKYIAKKYPGKITLIECGTFKDEYREGWKNLAGGGFESYAVEGTNHKTIVKEPQLRFFAEKLNFVLEKTHNELNTKTGTNGSLDNSNRKQKLEKVSY
ncbi:MAG: amino acid adenylation domain-containing protein [Bacteroidota bacterium]|nr:amino acid adenylation domain-containing protein [Bacteroidota bacterium]